MWIVVLASGPMKCPSGVFTCEEGACLERCLGRGTDDVAECKRACVEPEGDERGAGEELGCSWACGGSRDEDALVAKEQAHSDAAFKLAERHCGLGVHRRASRRCEKGLDDAIRCRFVVAGGVETSAWIPGRIESRVERHAPGARVYVQLRKDPARECERTELPAVNNVTTISGRTWHWIPLGLGTAAVVGGAAAFGVAFEADASADDARGPRALEDATARGEVAQTTGWALAAVGVALVATGLWAFFDVPESTAYGPARSSRTWGISF